jgi:hypothetical protein
LGFNCPDVITAQDLLSRSRLPLALGTTDRLPRVGARTAFSFLPVTAGTAIQQPITMLALIAALMLQRYVSEMRNAQCYRRCRGGSNGLACPC